jgi:serine/threonine protein kinase
MPFTPPSENLVLAAFPELQAITFQRAGGYKAVYLAKTAAGQEAFKLLCLPPTGTTGLEQGLRREQLGRALREVQLLSRVMAPEVVKLGSLAARIENISGVEYLGYTEEWLDGEDLWQIITATPARPAPTEIECRQLLLSLLRAIRAISDLNTIHRDIKPGNVIRLNRPDRPFVLLDLGIAYELNEASLTYEASQRMPPATYRYFAPEMASLDFRDRLTFRTDLYTAGLTVFEFATHQHPIAHKSDDLVLTLSRAIRQAPRTLQQVRGDISVEFSALIDQLLKKQPMLRGNLAQLIQRLEAWA